MAQNFGSNKDKGNLFQQMVNDRFVEIKYVTSENLSMAIDIAAMGFPGELKEVVQSFVSSTHPREQWTLSDAQQNIGDTFEYYLMYVDGQPAGVTGAYTLKNSPKETWLGWTSLAAGYRGLGLGKVLVDFAKNHAESAGQEIMRAWSVKTPSDRFGTMHDLLDERWDRHEIFRGEQHSFGDYHIFSTGLNGHEAAPYPDSASLAGGSKNALIETTALHDLKAAEANYASQKRQSEANRKTFLMEFGSVETYVRAGRLVDLSADIAAQKRTALTRSFETLNNKLFPVEEERENVFAPDGLKLYVQPDKTGHYAPSERRILVVLNEDKSKVVGAIVYNLAAFPDDLRTKHGVDATIGITYLMTDADYRQTGIGRELVTAAKKQSLAFLKDELGISHPRLMLMTEQNSPMQMTRDNCILDYAGASIQPTERASIWGRFGQQLVRGFNYVQVSLRQGLAACEGLGLHVTMPSFRTAIGSDLLAYAVRAYADLALNKQQRPIDNDHHMQDMISELSTHESFPLNPIVVDPQARDNKIMAALIQASVDPRSAPDDLTSYLLQVYIDKVERYSDLPALAYDSRPIQQFLPLGDYRI